MNPQFCCVPPNKAEMADNQWMYSGFFRRNEVTTEWAERTDVFLKEIFRRPMRMVPECPCAKCKRRIRRDQEEMTLHLRMNGFMPNFNMPINFAQRDCGREEVIRQRIAGHEDDGVRDMLDDVCAAQTAPATLSANERRRRRKPQRHSWISWPRQRNLFMRVPSSLSWMPSRN